MSRRHAMTLDRSSSGMVALRAVAAIGCAGAILYREGRRDAQSASDTLVRDPAQGHPPTGVSEGLCASLLIQQILFAALAELGETRGPDPVNFGEALSRSDCLDGGRMP